MSLQVKQQGQIIKPIRVKRRHSSEYRFHARKSKGQGINHGERRKYLADDGNISHRKRKAEFNMHPTSKAGGGIINLPKKFKLGGSIEDPLNLRSMEDEEVNRKENLVTPQSSPVPTPKHRSETIEVLIPPNIKDPLNLLADMTRSRKKKNRKRKSGDISSGSIASVSNADKNTSLSATATSDCARLQIIEGSEMNNIHSVYVERKQQEHRITTSATSAFAGSNRHDSPEKKSDAKTKPHKYRRKHSGHRYRPGVDDRKRDFRSPCKQRHKSKPSLDPTNITFNKKNEKFQYGNYNRYYGYRLADQPRDPRLDSFKKEWFDGKDVLDLGCNVGFVTLTIAKDFEPKKIIGLDIDGELIKCARKNIRHYLSPPSYQESKFPISMALCYGPIAAPPLFSRHNDAKFPNNVQFVQGNYVLENDDQLDDDKEEYDLILCLSLTKWIHLNWGDDGLRRTFKRIFKQLKPGGKLILEAQGWQSYKKKKKLTENVFKNYQSIKLKPDKFREHLLAEVGFSKCEVIATPVNKSKGFQRPIYLFTKGSKSPTYSQGSGSSSERKILE